MPFAEEWDRLYTSSRHLSIWPWTDVVALTLRHIRPASPDFRVLELGCGAGANIPFFRSLGVEYWAIEGSPAIVAQLRETYPDMAERMLVGDFTRQIGAPGQFDLILDRGSLTHNQTSCLRRSLQLLRNALKPTGHLLSVDMFSTDFSEFAEGEAGEDHYTRINFTRGRLAGTGVAHFADEVHLRDLLSDFTIEVLEHKTVRQFEPQNGVFAAWNIIARPANA
ncbi:MAG: class I SAM-dependent methyltransferase [Ferrovibrio sp.]|uniref:class I SAM-dependent methyltransferase n=1 Tax=Ferrovibrio sp. TaxID=1917215 RepID=UPI0026265BD0|nr:class I SAM-dependent methyltransferase [Ferrovibrio sp.]MCW0234923.1 class I SAM-dependent methyltransferase [Ferrovibrio sp.]